MSKQLYKVLGMMSGTSLDGLDMAYCHIWEAEGDWAFELKDTHSIAYNAEMRNKLKEAISFPADTLLKLHNSFGSWLGKQAEAFVRENRLEVDFIASHGHTIHHQPENGFTFQIGSGQHLANVSGIKTICDFRTQDVALGGEGAPLVPIGDQLFFSMYDFCLNLGGISNVSFVKNGQRLAYDIGLANMILNHITQKVDLAYDEGGQRASKGKLNTDMLQRLNELEYYKLPFPKSTGYEWFVEEVVPIVEGTRDSMENLLHTAIHHNCEQIARELKDNSSEGHHTLFITGGGALNTFFTETLQEKLGDTVTMVIPEEKLIEFKEALVFALMGVLRLKERVNVLSSVTGSTKDSSSGVIYLPI